MNEASLRSETPEIGFNQYADQRIKVIQGCDYQVLVLCDPIKRLLSAFSNKLIEDSGNKLILPELQSKTGGSIELITFRKFVCDYLVDSVGRGAAADDLGGVSVDPHFMSMHYFLLLVS